MTDLGTATDPLALIIAAGAGCISGLTSLVLFLVFGRMKRIETDVKEVANNLIGNDGMAVRIAKLEGRTTNTETRLAALESGTLSREIFERATRDQNSRLEELKEQTRELDHKLDRVDRAIPRTPSPYPGAYQIPPRGRPDK